MPLQRCMDSRPNSEVTGDLDAIDFLAVKGIDLDLRSETLLRDLRAFVDEA